MRALLLNAAAFFVSLSLYPLIEWRFLLFQVGLAIVLIVWEDTLP